MSGQLWIQVRSGSQSNCDSKEEPIDVQYEDAGKHVNQGDQEV